MTLASEAFDGSKENAREVTEPEQAELIAHVPNWQVVTEEGASKLKRMYKFKNFVEALAFTNKVGDLAESEDHHPDILLEYGKATVTWWSHNIKGLHRNDFIMAARTDALYE